MIKTVHRNINFNRKTNRYRVRFKKNKTDQILFNTLKVICSYKREKQFYAFNAQDLPSNTNSIHFNVFPNSSSSKIKWDKDVIENVKLANTER